VKNVFSPICSHKYTTKQCIYYTIIYYILYEMHLLLLAFWIFSGLAYDLNQANVSVYLSGAAYCGKDKYKSMTLSGPTQGFVYEDTIYDIKTDLQGYIGYLPSTKSIYVALRGSSSALNWLDDAEIKLVDYTSFPDCKCKVHYGFYRSIQGIVNRTISTVSLLRKRFPQYTVIMTGHSYGASTVQLLAMELAKTNITTAIYNFGQPRPGEARYASFVNSVIPNYWRFTHNKDAVPHLPPMDVMGYSHSCREVFENEAGVLKLCSALNCEDASCADQYSLAQTNSDDHLVYLGHRVDCDTSTI